MNSLDTNILVYAANRGAPEHGKALAVVETMLARPSEWILADQVLWEFCRALRRHGVTVLHTRNDQDFADSGLRSNDYDPHGDAIQGGALAASVVPGDGTYVRMPEKDRDLGCRAHGQPGSVHRPIHLQPTRTFLVGQDLGDVADPGLSGSMRYSLAR